MNGKIQKGYVWRVKRSWYGRWYQDEFDKDGNTVRVQHSEWLCEYSDVYRSKKDVLKLLADKLRPINDDRAAPEGTLTVAKYFEKFFLPYADRELKNSNVCLSGVVSMRCAVVSALPLPTSILLWLRNPSCAIQTWQRPQRIM